MNRQVHTYYNKKTHLSLQLRCLSFIGYFIFCLLQPVLAAEQELGINQVNAGRLLFQTDNKQLYQPALLLNTVMNMEVNGMVATVNVRQHFKNTSEQWLEGTYVFPLPEDAAVNKMQIQIGERIIKGTVKEKKQAKKIYQQAKAAGKQASLVEQQRPNLFTNSIANIAPNTEIIVEITYLQKVIYDQGEFKLRFPMTITPRYTPGKIASNELGQQNLSVNHENGWVMNKDQILNTQQSSQSEPAQEMPSNDSNKQLINPIHISGSIDLSMPLEAVNSLYHAINVRPLNNQYHFELSSSQVSMDRDFVISWRPSIGQAPKAGLFAETIKSNDSDDNFVMLMLMPPQFLAEGNRLPREMIFVIDTSGSMGGTSIRQAKSGLKYALSLLSEHDRFNIIEFNSYTKSFFPQSVIANSTNMNQAQNYVDSLNADGGTEMAPALTAALQDNIPQGFLRQVVFMTDGSVSNEQQLFSIIHQHLKDARLFTIGIGSAPNSYFMSKAAQFGRGTFTYIGSVNEVQQKISHLFNKLEAPVLSHLQLVLPQESEVYPKRIPDLYMGEPLIISAKIAKLDGEILIKGQTQQGEWQRQFNLQQGSQHHGISSIWARSKIEALMDKKVKDKTETRQQIIEVALKHQLLSQYTSFIAVDETPVRDPSIKVSRQGVANLLPKGQTQKAYSFPQTATPAMRNILIGLLIIFFMSGYSLFRQKKHIMIMSS